MEYGKLPGTTVEDEGDISCTNKEGGNQAAVDSIDIDSKGSTQNLIDLIDLVSVTDKAVTRGSSEDESDVAESSGDETEEVGASATFRGDAVDNEASSRAWYRPEQRRKGKRGRGGNKNKSRKGRARGKQHHNKENMTDCAVTENKDNQATNDTLCDQPRAKSGSTPLDAANVAKGAIPKEKRMKNKSSQRMHAKRRQPTRSVNVPTLHPAASADVLPSVGIANSSSFSSQRSTHSTSEVTNLVNSTPDLEEVFRNRPRNWSRPQVSRRQAAAAARMRRYRDVDDYASLMTILSSSVTLLDLLLSTMVPTHVLSNYDSD